MVRVSTTGTYMSIILTLTRTIRQQANMSFLGTKEALPGLRRMALTRVGA